MANEILTERHRGIYLNTLRWTKISGVPRGVINGWVKAQLKRGSNKDLAEHARKLLPNERKRMGFDDFNGGYVIDGEGIEMLMKCRPFNVMREAYEKVKQEWDEIREEYFARHGDETSEVTPEMKEDHEDKIVARLDEIVALLRKFL